MHDTAQIALVQGASASAPSNRAAASPSQGRPPESISSRTGVPSATVQLAPTAIARLQRYPWPGNVRELENCIESAVVIMDGSEMGAGDLPLPDRPPQIHSRPAPSWEGKPPSSPDRESEKEVMTLDEVERRHVLSVLARVDHNQTLAAKLLGIGRNTLSRKLKRWRED